jgi:hypothetical protein
MSQRSLRTVRAASALVVALSLVGLGVMTVGGDHTVTKHTTVVKGTTAAAKVAPTTTPSPPPSPVDCSR